MQELQASMATLPHGVRRITAALNTAAWNELVAAIPAARSGPVLGFDAITLDASLDPDEKAGFAGIRVQLRPE